MAQQQTVPAQEQGRQPGHQSEMHPQPRTIREDYHGTGKLKDRVVLVCGGDSGIGRSAAVHLAREGANVLIAYLDEDDDAEVTRQMVAAEGAPCLSIKADLTRAEECKRAVRQAVEAHGRIDVLVHSVARQYPQQSVEDITPEQLDLTFRTNVFSAFFMVQAAVPHMPEGSAIVFTGSVNGARGNARLIDYASTKGALHNLTYSLAQSLSDRGIRVNLVAPGPVWTPLIPSSFKGEQVASFGAKTLMKRPGQPEEIGPAYVYFASADSSYVTGQVLHINGGGFIGD